MPGPSLGTKTGSAQWGHFKLESPLGGRIGTIKNVLVWETNNALAVLKGN